MQWLIEVNYKPGFFDALGNTVKKDIEDLGISGTKKVRTSQLYRIEGEIIETDLKLLCEELLTDKITQQYKIRAACSVHNNPPPRCHNGVPAPFSKGGERGINQQVFIVQVWHKKGVTDAVADTVKKGAVDLGIKGIDTVKTGYEYTIMGNVISESRRGDKEQIEKICSGLLANKVVQDYNIITTKTRNLENTKFFRRADL